MKIRREEIKDFNAIEKVIREAFSGLSISRQDEHKLVKRLRQTKEYIPELSLVSEVEGEIIGHILLTRVKITNDDQSIDGLALAPVSVLPAHQNSGVGKGLINKSLESAASLGFEIVVVLGHSGYYPKFGFEVASKWNIKSPFEVPDELFMVKELKKGCLENIQGMVNYSPAFFE